MANRFGFKSIHGSCDTREYCPHMEGRIGITINYNRVVRKMSLMEVPYLKWTRYLENIDQKHDLNQMDGCRVRFGSRFFLPGGRSLLVVRSVVHRFPIAACFSSVGTVPKFIDQIWFGHFFLRVRTSDSEEYTKSVRLI